MASPCDNYGEKPPLRRYLCHVLLKPVVRAVARFRTFSHQLHFAGRNWEVRGKVGMVCAALSLLLVE